MASGPNCIRYKTLLCLEMTNIGMAGQAGGGGGVNDSYTHTMRAEANATHTLLSYADDSVCLVAWDSMHDSCLKQLRFSGTFKSLF